MNRFFDLLLFIIITPFVLPIFIVVSILALIFHGNDIFFKQERLGKDKKIFNLYKFRSMIIGAQSIGTGLYSYADDKRITRFGRFIRKTSLDEIPQLYNILNGEMSFVGPRPSVVGELEDEKDLPDYTDERFKIKPGLTGWAQIHGRDNLSWAEKIAYDVEFVRAPFYRRVFMCIYVICFTPLFLLNFSATYEKRK